MPDPDLHNILGRFRTYELEVENFFGIFALINTGHLKEMEDNQRKSHDSIGLPLKLSWDMIDLEGQGSITFHTYYHCDNR